MRTPLTTLRDYACAVLPSQALRELRRCTRLEVVSFRGCSRLTDQAVGFLMPMQALQLLCLDLALTPTPTLTLTLTLTRRRGRAAASMAGPSGTAARAAAGRRAARGRAAEAVYATMYWAD